MVMSIAKNGSASAYEELRRKRMEENRKRMEELQLPRLSLALNPSPKPPKPSPMKRIKRTEVVEVRRSGRVAKLPAPVYREIVTYERPDLPKRPYSYKRKDLANRVYASDEARAAATYKAEELEISLGADYPTFVKPMLQSHVTGGFWLGLPNHWCRKYLPRRDDTVTLIDEEGEEYPTVYLWNKNGLSGGWRGFSLAHELVDGDALVFQLIRPTTFKVYITRANGYEKGDTVEALEAYFDQPKPFSKLKTSSGSEPFQFSPFSKDLLNLTTKEGLVGVVKF
ncbi:B3 domain-containing protein [Heracleum sosnowskyi]|uniref:B3 domain-containing protein n=1 Tax=Heracleum sosnowskyi TaxID=360622 RepID=A0AAD8N3Z2_9APIA|nr:B3 domain-containing protein [Heracleum sosnowskyi]